MTRLIKLLAAAFLCACSLPAGVGAQPVAATDEGETVSVPFSPPLNRPLRYRVTRTISRAAVGAPFWTDYEISFSRSGSGYRMLVRVADVSARGASQDQTAQIRRQMMEASPPFVLLLGEDAAVQGMENADAYWENMLATIQRLARQADGSEVNEAVLDQVTAMMRDSSPEGRLNVLTQYIVPVIELAGTEFSVGEELEVDAPIEGLMGLTMDQTIRLRAERIETGRLFVTSNASIAEADMRRAVQEFLARIPVTGQGTNTAGERERIATQLANARYDRTIEQHYEVALDTGLIARFSSEERISAELGGEAHRQVRTVLIERRD